MKIGYGDEGPPADPRPRCYRLQLYVAGPSRRSRDAVENVSRLCRKLGSQVHLEVIDIFQQTERAVQQQVVAVPTLVRSEPEPSRRLVGDLSDESRVCRALDLET